MPERFDRLTDTELRVTIDSLRNGLYRAWRRNQPGSTTAVYDLARALAEASVRGCSVAQLPLPGQLALFPARRP